MNRVVVCLCAFPLLGASCGDDTAKPVVDIDNGSCGDQLRFTGELVDWDSSDAQFCGVMGAQFGPTDVTPPNGRFDVCLPAEPRSQVAVTPSADASQCAGAKYPIPAVISVDHDAIRAGARFSARLFTATRETTLFTQIGEAFDPSKAQVLVFVDGTARAVSISSAHGAAQAFTSTWAAGDTGSYVFFPNVDPAGGTTTITVAGGAIGAGAVPLTAGTLTATNVYVR